ncbi:BQ5605_C031g10921 [Microbotryum silenes-dioicae]|uniref:BQ5605_C031g10921 protein n=1 Tax=Microbotryum silenes-dioicae TaxID=796604 RepID=A0A2X0PHV2_9BASI|nr:BQ5605_C031g10921 [Microbotryum silenes-dioicae]
MTTMQPILALRHVYEPAVQLCRTDSVVSAMANSTLGSPHHHLLRKGECAGLETRSNPSSPTHFGACCSQGKNARSYNNVLSFTSLAALWDQTQVGTLGPPVFRVFGRLYHRLGALIPAVNQCPTFAQTWLINPAEATDTRLEPDGADIHMQRSTLTKLESMLRTKNHFVREFASAKPRAGWDTAKEWILRLCLPPDRDRRTHNPPTSSTGMAMLICDSDTNTGDSGPQDLILQVHGDRCPDGRPKYQIVSSLHPSAMPLRYPLLFPAGEDGFHPNIPLCGFHQAGPPIARNREQIDNGVQLRELLDGFGPDEEDEEEDEDRDNEDEDGEEGDEEDGDGERQVKGSRWRVSRSPFFVHYLPNATSTSQSRIAPNVPSWKPTPHHDPRHQRLDPEPNRDITQRYQDAMACVVKEGKPPLLITMTACNRPDLIARVFEAKSGNKRHAGCFGNECKMNGFCFFAVLRV